MTRRIAIRPLCCMAGAWLVLAGMMGAARADGLSVAHWFAGPPAERPALTVDWAALERLYRPRQFAPVWIDSAGPSQRAEILLAVLERVQDDGLDPADYPIFELLDRWHAREPARLAELELLLSDALIRYAAQVHDGRLDPRFVDANWYVEREPSDPVALAAAVIESPALLPALAGLAPRHDGYQRLRKALQRYQSIAARGGWVRVPDAGKLEVGARSPAVASLRERLVAEGDLEPAVADAAHDTEVFDEALAAAVRRFQARHGLEVDGIVGDDTRAALNVSVQARIRQIALNLERWRWLPREMGERYLMVNMAGFTLSAVEAGETQWDMRVIIGKVFRETPAFASRIRYLVLNPYWNVPPRIAREDLLPEQIKDVGFLQRKGIRILTDWSRDAAELDPQALDWSQWRDPGTFPYRLRQDPGPANSLGRIKFMLPNRFHVYLHDTPARHLFSRTVRTFSSGCIRVEDPAALAAYLLEGQGGWDAGRVQAAIDAGATRTLVLARPVPIYLLYWTAWAEADGTVHFREDVYRRDQRLATVDPAHAG